MLALLSHLQLNRALLPRLLSLLLTILLSCFGRRLSFGYFGRNVRLDKASFSRRTALDAVFVPLLLQLEMLKLSGALLPGLFSLMLSPSLTVERLWVYLVPM